MEARVDAVVFDLFRTLVDPESRNPTAFRRVERLAAGLDLEPRQLAIWWDTTRDLRIRGRSPGLMALLEGYSESIGSPRSRVQIAGALLAADSFHDRALLHPHSRVVAVLRRLRGRGLKVGVLSNTDDHESRLWPDSPLAPLVDAVGLSVDTGFAKPEPESYLAILAALGVNEPRRAVFVGDGEGHELLGAKQVGFASSIFTKEFVASTGFQTPKKLAEIAHEADATIDRLGDLLPYLHIER